MYCIELYLWAGPPLTGARTIVSFCFLWWKLHQLTGFDLTSTERTAGVVLWTHRETDKNEYTEGVLRSGVYCTLCWRQSIYLPSADDLCDAGPTVNVSAVCDDRETDRVQTHRALLVRAAGQHQPQLLYQTLPQLRWCRCLIWMTMR